MVDNKNIQIPQDLTNLFRFEQTTEPLRKFLIELVRKQNELEQRVKDLENA